VFSRKLLSVCQAIASLKLLNRDLLPWEAFSPLSKGASAVSHVCSWSCNSTAILIFPEGLHTSISELEIV
jgi:hypothetical protein